MDIFSNEQSLTERLELIIERIKEIPDELAHSEGLADSFYLDFFNSKAILYLSNKSLVRDFSFSASTSLLLFSNF